MADSAFRTASDSSGPLPQPEYEVDDSSVGYEEQDIEPLDIRESRSGDVLLDALGLDDDVSNLPDEQKENVLEVKQYVKDVLKQKGRSDTVDSFNKTLSELKEYVGLDENADPDVVIDRIGNLIKSYKSLAFVTDAKERRSLFMKLAKQESSQEMDRMVFEEMTRRNVWRTQ